MDADLFRSINSFQVHTSWLHGFARSYAATTGPAVLALLVLVGLALARRRDVTATAQAIWAGLAPLLAVALNQPLVQAFHRPRPFTALPHVLTLVHHSADGGLPSDHATLAGAVAAGLLLLDRRLGAVAVVAGVLLAAVRVYVGVHYPGDVLAGLALGTAVALLGWLLLRSLLVRLVELLQRTVVRPVLRAS